jgi:RsiW-degrading membrane proteinase PrsW (M82 family)
MGGDQTDPAETTHSVGVTDGGRPTDETDPVGASTGDGETDPVEASTGDGETVDLYEVSTWEERSRLDGFAVALYRLITATARGAVVLVGLVLLFGIGAFSAVTNPAVGVLTALSALPALGLAAYVYLSDVTASEPPSLLFGTFLLSVVTATFAAVLNGLAQPPFAEFGFLGLVVFFFVFVGPVEETVKLLAVRLYAYSDDRFRAVIDGAVYGAMAGLGFAFIENALYIERQVMGATLGSGLALVELGAGITLTRALAGPGHVIYSAFAGYYLGLAKFNPENRGPIVVKGLVIAALIHATYNSTVGLGTAAFTALGLPQLGASFAYILLYDGFFAALLLRKIRRYRRLYRSVDAASGSETNVATGSPTADRTSAGNSMSDRADASDTRFDQTTDTSPSAERRLTEEVRGDDTTSVGETSDASSGVNTEDDL